MSEDVASPTYLQVRNFDVMIDAQVYLWDVKIDSGETWGQAAYQVAEHPCLC